MNWWPKEKPVYTGMITEKKKKIMQNIPIKQNNPEKCQERLPDKKLNIYLSESD